MRIVYRTGNALLEDIGCDTVLFGLFGMTLAILFLVR